jgi:formylglycine-generating enzyme required for sulfatase activity
VAGDIRATQVNMHVEHQYNLGVGGPVPVSSPAKVLDAYLGWVVETQSALRLSDIIEGIVAADSRPLELRQVFVELNTHLRIPEKQSLAEYLKPQSSRGAERKGQSTFFRPVPGRQGGQGGEESTEFRTVGVFETLSQHRAIVLVGDPGSGKSTVGQFIALALAGGGLGRSDLLPQLRMGEGFRPPVPVFLVLRDLAAGLDAGSGVGRAADVWTHLRATLRACGKPAAWADAVQGAVEERGGWFILDGWDETADPAKLVRVAEAVSDLVRNSGKACRFLLTSRFYAWDAVQAAREDRKQESHDARSVQDAGRFRKALAGLGREFGARYDVEPLVDPQIREFVGKWYAAIESGALAWFSSKDAARKRAELEVAVAREDLKPVMANPLLLTLTAALSGTHLPDDRADLFDKIVDLLLRRWTEANGAAPSLRERLGRAIRQEDIRRKMEECAFEAHRGHAGKEGVADIPESALLNAFASLLDNDLNAARQVIEFVQHRAGLLIGKGAPLGDPSQPLIRQFACPHRSLQEYLAGRCLANRSTFTASGTSLTSDAASAVSLARQDPGHWREVLAFAARTAGPDRGSLSAALLVHETPLQEYARNHAVTETDWRCAVLAGHQLLEIGHTAIAGDPSALRRWRLVAGWLAGLVEQEGLPSVRERAEVAKMLGRLGDPRPGVVPAWPPTAEAPFFAWGKRVEAGTEFVMGGDPKAWQGKGSRKIQFPAPFRLARYPVTNAQYDLFEGSAYFLEKGLRPRDKRDLRFNAPNQPVVNVSWHDAMHFCEWISGELAAGRVQPDGLGVETEDLKVSRQWHIRLPTDAEWEYAARGAEGRFLPWAARGQEDTVTLSERCNMAETGLGETSAVGLFPKGKSTEDCLDLIGNVWEWTRSRYRDEPEDFADQLIATTDSDEVRVLRGGSWCIGGRVDLRCATRLDRPPGFRYDVVGFRCVLVGGLVAGG